MSMIIINTVVITFIAEANTLARSAITEIIHR